MWGADLSFGWLIAVALILGMVYLIVTTFWPLLLIGAVVGGIALAGRRGSGGDA